MLNYQRASTDFAWVQADVLCDLSVWLLDRAMAGALSGSGVGRRIFGGNLWCVWIDFAIWSGGLVLWFWDEVLHVWVSSPSRFPKREYVHGSCQTQHLLLTCFWCFFESSGFSDLRRVTCWILLISYDFVLLFKPLQSLVHPLQSVANSHLPYFEHLTLWLLGTCKDLLGHLAAADECDSDIFTIWIAAECGDQKHYVSWHHATFDIGLFLTIYIVMTHCFFMTYKMVPRNQVSCQIS